MLSRLHASGHRLNLTEESHSAACGAVLAIAIGTRAHRRTRSILDGSVRTTHRRGRDACWPLRAGLWSASSAPIPPSVRCLRLPIPSAPNHCNPVARFIILERNPHEPAPYLHRHRPDFRTRTRRGLRLVLDGHHVVERRNLVVNAGPGHPDLVAARRGTVGIPRSRRGQTGVAKAIRSCYAVASEAGSSRSPLIRPHSSSWMLRYRVARRRR